MHFSDFLSGLCDLWDKHSKEQKENILICGFFSLFIIAIICVIIGAAVENNKEITVEVPASYFSVAKIPAAENTVVWNKRHTDFKLESTPEKYEMTLYIDRLPYKEINKRWAIALSCRMITINITEDEFDEVYHHNTYHGYNLKNKLRLEVVWSNKIWDVKYSDIVFE